MPRRLSPFTKGLSVTLADARGEVFRLEEQARSIETLLARARAEAVACEMLIVRAAADQTLLDVAPVTSWNGRYGERGALKDAILKLIESASAEGISTGDLCRRLIPIFSLTFTTRDKRNDWRRNSVRNALRKLESTGEVRKTRLTTATLSNVWRLVPLQELTLAEIKASARAANVAVVGPTSQVEHA